MAKAKTPSQKKAYEKLKKRLAKYVGRVRAIYDTLNLEASKVAFRTNYDPSNGKEFHFKDYPQTTAQIEAIQEQFVREMGTTIISGTSAEWGASNELQDLLADKVMKAYNVKRGDARTKRYYQVNNDALKSFQQRKDNGMSLSEKLWNQSEDYKRGLESAISTAIEKGMSAVILSKKVSKYLKNFDSLKKDYKQKFGKATDAKDCEYRSIRLARSEINMAYRNAEQLRWQQMDFILGYEIKLSHSHPCHDICDELKGKYPKDFKWTGWHPNDLCYVVPIIKSEEQFWLPENERGNNNAEITDVPQEFKTWVANNQDRIARAEKRGTLPYFVRDNRERVKLLGKGEANLFIQSMNNHDIVRLSPKINQDEVAQKIYDVISDIQRDGYSKSAPFEIALVEDRMKNFAIKNGIPLASESIYIRPKDIAHTLRNSKKVKGINITNEELVSFPSKINEMDLYYNQEDNNFIYFNGVAKFVIHPNYEMKIGRKKKSKVNFITASRVSSDQEFNMQKYKKI